MLYTISVKYTSSVYFLTAEGTSNRQCVIKTSVCSWQFYELPLRGIIYIWNLKPPTVTGYWDYIHYLPIKLATSNCHRILRPYTLSTNQTCSLKLLQDIETIYIIYISLAASNCQRILRRYINIIYISNLQPPTVTGYWDYIHYLCIKLAASNCHRILRWYINIIYVSNLQPQTVSGYCDYKHYLCIILAASNCFRILRL